MRILISLILLLAFACSSEPEKVSKPNPQYQFNRKTLNLRGEPEAVYELNFKQYDADSLTSEMNTRENYFFDEEGKVVRKETYIDKQGHPNKNEFEYDKHGNILEVRHYDDGGNFTHKTVNVFDSVGNVKEIINQNDDGKNLYRTKRKYDTHGNIVEYQQLEPLSPVVHKRRYEYDEKGRCILKEDVSTRSREVITYDSTGTVTNISTYRDNILSSEQMTMVDNKGRVVSSAYKFDGVVINERFQYDSLGNILEFIKGTNGVTDSATSYRRQYEYDHHYNWTKRTTLDLKGKPRNSLERTIVY